MQDRLRNVVEEKLHDAGVQITELQTLIKDLRQAAPRLTAHRPAGPCDEACGCLSEPSATATAPTQVVSLSRKPRPVKNPCTAKRNTEKVAVVGVGAAAFVACCAGPILGVLTAIGVGTVAAVAWFGVIGLTVAAAGGEFLLWRRGRVHTGGPDPTGTTAVPIGPPALRKGPMPRLGVTGADGPPPQGRTQAS